jgi:hypothetical protein
MSYFRVIPRDLFNEGNLLNCLGKLYMLLEKSDTGKIAKLEDSALSDGFDIEQDESDGSISVVNLPFLVNDEEFRLFRPLNARSNSPLYIETSDGPVRVFDEEQGENLSGEFHRWILERTK